MAWIESNKKVQFSIAFNYLRAQIPSNAIRRVRKIAGHRSNINSVGCCMNYDKRHLVNPLGTYGFIYELNQKQFSEYTITDYVLTFGLTLLAVAAFVFPLLQLDWNTRDLLIYLLALIPIRYLALAWLANRGVVTRDADASLIQRSQKSLVYKIWFSLFSVFSGLFAVAYTVGFIRNLFFADTAISVQQTAIFILAWLSVFVCIHFWRGK